MHSIAAKAVKSQTGYLLCSRWFVGMQGTSNGFRPCIYNSGGSNADYSKDTGVKVLWLIFWVVQQAWLVGFSSVMGHALFGKSAPCQTLSLRSHHVQHITAKQVTVCGSLLVNSKAQRSMLCRTA